MIDREFFIPAKDEIFDQHPTSLRLKQWITFFLYSSV